MNLTDVLILALAALAAITATGLIAGYAMQPFIVAYWLVLTLKNVIDYLKRK